jgi:uncharacterized SAM-binding protein YcdF (DUF218 family)
VPGVRHNPGPFATAIQSAIALNDLFALLDLHAWKPVLTALLLPPVPLLALVLLGAHGMTRRRGWGWVLILLAVAGMWLSACNGAGRLLEQWVLRPPSALAPERIQALKADPKNTAIVVLGGGVEALAPEYGTGNLAPLSLERLRYGLWLSRETGVPVAFSGGIGWSGTLGGASEAEAAARIAAHDFRLPLRWTEAESRDTRQNAGYTVALLKGSGITRIVLVTHGWHMPRGLRAFEDAARPAGMQVEAAPMGLAAGSDVPVLHWLPSGHGFQRVRHALREWLGRLVGA